MPTDDTTRAEIARNRWELLEQIEDWIETPMMVLGFVWLVLLVIDLVSGLPLFLERANTAIWILFILDFLLRFLLAPRKLAYLRHNLLTALSLTLPALRALRFLRVLRLARVTRGWQLVRVLGSLNRGIRATRAALGRRRFGYVLALTVLITVVGAAGMYALEPASASSPGFQSYGDALWWTAMLMTSIGSEYWPHGPEARLLCFILALYGFAVFGYITATFASLFIGLDADAKARTGEATEGAAGEE
jgi:voltage-gated potassium channel